MTRQVDFLFSKKVARSPGVCVYWDFETDKSMLRLVIAFSYVNIFVLLAIKNNQVIQMIEIQVIQAKIEMMLLWKGILVDPLHVIHTSLFLLHVFYMYILSKSRLTLYIRFYIFIWQPSLLSSHNYLMSLSFVCTWLFALT